MKRVLLLAIAVALSPLALSAQEKPVIVVQTFTAVPSVVWPYDMKTMQSQTVAELNVMLGKSFDVVAETPSTAHANVYSLAVEVTDWHHGNAAKRLLVGLGSGRESADIQFRITDGSGKSILDRKETVRTNFYSQGAGSVGTLTHPIAEKISGRIKAANLK